MTDSSNISSSFYVDELKSSLSNLRTSIFGRNVAQSFAAGEDAKIGASPADLDQLAKINEDIRERCISIVNRVDALAGLRDDFVEVFGEVGKALKDAERTTSALLERSAMLALEEEEHGALKARHRALHEDYEKKSNEHCLMRTEVEKYGDLVLAREARIEALEQELSDEKNQSAALRAELEQARHEAGLTGERLEAALNDIRADEAMAAGLHAQIAALSDRSAAAEFHVSALEGSLSESQGLVKTLREQFAESQQCAEGLSRKLEGSNAELEALKCRSAAIEAALSSTRLEHELTQSIWNQKEQAAADEIVDLKGRLDCDGSRAEAAEALLAAARAELQSAGSELRAKEREVELLAARIGPLDERLESAAREIAALSEANGEAEKSRVQLADRAQALVRAMTDQSAKLFRRTYC